MKSLALAILLALSIASTTFAIGPDEMLKDPALEARARTIGQSLRCLVCQNQSIDDSDASLARDLRILVRERLTAGDSDQAVIAYVVSRYGDFVLLRPPMKPETWVLWFGPLLLLVGVGSLIVVRARRKRVVNTTPLSADEQAELARLIETGTEAKR
jgi:cytochrome c-type biogenesis protein CcmH